MEAKNGQVRRLYIIYFLSHTGGRAEHPHLIRVLHLARNGVYLRDVKRWLGELRGKDLPESFAWSYKRRYKSGYVWQDLMDEDLITPISDNEYVLKGSQIYPTQFETSSINEKKIDTDIPTDQNKSSQVQVEEDNQQQHPSLSSSSEEEQPQIQQDMSQDSIVCDSERSSVTDDDSCSKVEQEKLLGTGKLESLNEKNQVTFSLPSLYHNMMSKKGNKINHNKTDHTPDSSSFSTPTSSSSTTASLSSFSKIRSSSSRVSNVFRNWISCGTVETNDAALVRKSAHRILPKEPNNMPEEKGAKICKGDKMGGSARCFGTPWNCHEQNEQYGARKSCDGEETNRGRKKLIELMNQAPCKPICSQCGKSFKPEKMHQHMKSCKGIKANGSSAATTAEEKQLLRSTLSCNDYLLKN